MKAYFRCRVDGGASSRQARVRFQGGQRVIVGKSGMGQEGTALILVLSARVVE